MPRKSKLKVIKEDKKTSGAKTYQSTDGNKYTRSELLRSAKLREKHNLIVSTSSKGKKYLKTKPDNTKDNNIKKKK